MVRAYIVAGMPDKVRRLASFEGWSDHVASMLFWLGGADECHRDGFAGGRTDAMPKVRSNIILVSRIGRKGSLKSISLGSRNEGNELDQCCVYPLI
jgi:hypothetical protein